MLEMKQAHDQAFEAYSEALKRDLEANYAGGYAQMPHAVRNDPTLSPKSKIIYEQLLSYMWFQTDRCWPSQATIAEGTGYSRRSVIRGLIELYERGYIERLRRGQGNTNYYFINPLSFVGSFRRTEREPVANMVVAVNNPMRQQTLEQTERRPLFVVPEKCQSVTSRSDRLALPEVTDWHTKNTKTNLDSSKQERDTDSSGFAADLREEEVRPVAAIRNTEPLASSFPTNTSPRTSKPSSVPAERSGAEPAKEEKEEKTGEKLSKWQEMAVAQGVSLVQQDALDSYMRHTPRPPSVPLVVEGCIDEVAKRFNDAQHLIANRTQAAKLWHYARLKGVDHGYLEDTFRLWVQTAALVPPHVGKKMAWFFKALRLEVLKALLPYECIAPVTEEQREGEQETSTHDAEALPQEHDVSPANDEQGGGQGPCECEGEQETSTHDVAPTPPSAEQEFQQQQEPEYLMTDDPDAGWATWASAAHYAERLCGWVAMTTPHSVEVLPTRFGRYGFYLYEVSTPHLVLEYVTTGEVAARIEQEKEKQRLSSRRSLR